MQFEIEQRSIGDLVELYRAEILKANPEYQRGIVWSEIQKQKLIDSVLRGYPLPLIYLYYTNKTIAGMNNEGFEVIDGQQRIRSLFEFSEGAFKLLDPKKDAKRAKFPAFIRDQPCEWAGCDIHNLPHELKEQLYSTQLAVAKIASGNSNEVRDIFVRLQSGLPLNHQETRDAWPGDFTEYVLRIGGKPELPRYPGHDYFTKVLKMQPLGDRGKTRQLAAQIAMLVFKRRETGKIVDIDAGSLNDYYYENLGFESGLAEPKRFIAIIDKMVHLLQGRKGPKLRGHDAIHLILLADSLWDDYLPDWMDRLPTALDKFVGNLAEDKKRREYEPGPYWIRYGQWTRASSDTSRSISARHQFYVEEMSKLLQPLKLKDPQRIYGELDRTIIYTRQKGTCAVCAGQLAWDDCEIHHVQEHSKGGATDLKNGAAVHKKCHPKGASATSAFAAQFHQLTPEDASGPD